MEKYVCEHCVQIWYNTMILPTWKILSTRMEHRELELFNRIKDKDVAAYREAVNYVEGNIGRILECSITIGNS